MRRDKSVWLVGAWMVGTCAAAALGQKAGQTAATKPANQAQKHGIFYSLEHESLGAVHRRSAWFETDARKVTSVRLKILLVAPNVGNRSMTKQISKTHHTLRNLYVDPKILWQRAADDKHRRKHARITSPEQAVKMVRHYVDRPDHQLNVFVVELDVDLDGDGKSDPAVGVRSPSDEAASARVDVILINSAVIDTYRSTISHAIGHYLGLVSAKGDKATYEFRQDGAQTGCKPCLKSVGASPAP